MVEAGPIHRNLFAPECRQALIELSDWLKGRVRGASVKTLEFRDSLFKCDKIGLFTVFDAILTSRQSG